MAKGRLSKAEKFTIETMYEQDNEIDEIADFLGRSSQAVQKHVDSVFEPEEEVQEESGKKNPTQFVRRTAAQNNRGVSIMTEAESSRSELTRGKKQSKIVKRFKPTTHIISKDDGQTKN